MIPKPVMKLTNLVSLDLRGNHFKEITIEINKLKSLRELIIADNQLTEIPSGVYDLPILENLFLNNNHIKSIDPFKINAMKFLTTLNLQNNDLLTIPIELGKAEHLKSLQLEGNPFRVPRPQILAKGTLAILEYLRGRIAES
jgi:Leucine-rich repeat (LRR) protein